jgi:hypothetical protein
MGAGVRGGERKVIFLLSGLGSFPRNSHHLETSTFQERTGADKGSRRQIFGKAPKIGGIEAIPKR